MRAFFVGLLALAVGCAESEPEEEAIAQASNDFDCDTSRIDLLDSIGGVEVGPSGSTTTSTAHVRVLACGHDVVYDCELRRRHRRSFWACSGSGYRFDR